MEGPQGQAPAASTPSVPAAPLPASPSGPAPEAAPAEAQAPVTEAPAPEANPYEEYIEKQINPETRDDWMKSLDADLEAEGKESHSVEPIDWNDPDPQKMRLHQSNLIRRMHKATTEASDLRKMLKDMEARVAAAEAQSASYQQNITEMIDPSRHEGSITPKPEGPRPDLYTDADGWFEWGAQMREHNRDMRQVAQYQGVIDEQKRRTKEAKRQQQRVERDAWIESLPEGDFDRYYNGMVDLVKKHNFHYQKAYEYLKSQDELASFRELNTLEADARGSLAVPSSRRAPGTLPPTPPLSESFDVVALNRWYDQNPGTRERDAAEYARRQGWRS